MKNTNYQSDIMQILEDAVIKEINAEIDELLIRRVQNAQPGDVIFVGETPIGQVDKNGRLVDLGRVPEIL